MKILWLGQAGLLLVSGKTKIMIDPYLTDSLSKFNHEYTRKLKVNKKLFKIKPNAIIITNNHSDHADPKTIEKMIKHIKRKSEVTILSCKNVFDQLVEIPTICQANNIMLEEGSEWTIGTINICAVPAKTDDKSAFGVIITDYEDNKKYYIAGDTLYNKYIFKHIPNDIYATFLPINGTCGSMNLADAKRFASNISSCNFVPYHFGMFEKTDTKKIDLKDAVIPQPYKIIAFSSSEASPLKKQLDSKFNEKKKKVKKKKSSASDDTDDSPLISTNDDTPLSYFDGYDDTDEDNDFIKIDNDVEIDELDDDVDEIAEDVDFDIDADVEIDVPFEEGNWEDFVSSPSDENKADTEDDASSDSDDIDNIDSEDIEKILDEDDDLDNLIEEDVAQESSSKKITDDNTDSDKIDAYIREIEKFERGETTDFSTID